MAIMLFSISWDNGSITDAGAATFANGTTGITGAVSTSNSLYGTTSGDQVGNAIALTNGNYVIGSSSWDNGSIVDAGAMTFGNGTTGTTGAVSTSNSLYGSSINDAVGSTQDITALTNGNFISRNVFWNNGSIVDAGAVTFGNGSTGTTGAVSSSNSLVGSTTNDRVGLYFPIALSNGNYIVQSGEWDNGSIVDAGAVTFGNGTTGTTGIISTSNSLVGSTTNDQIGGAVAFGGVKDLSNGNHVISSSKWDNGSTTDAGAVTWVDGSTGLTLDGNNTINAQNSILGTSASSSPGRSFDESVNSTFITRFSGESTGRITLGFADPAQMTFSRATGSSLTVTPDFLTRTLNAGTAVTLQANNDITVSSAITVNNTSGNGGNLTFLAGRSILVNANITTDNGNLSLTANADNAISLDRDTGTGVISLQNATLNTGTGTLTLNDIGETAFRKKRINEVRGTINQATQSINRPPSIANNSQTSPITGRVTTQRINPQHNNIFRGPDKVVSFQQHNNTLNWPDKIVSRTSSGNISGASTPSPINLARSQRLKNL